MRGSLRARRDVVMSDRREAFLDLLLPDLVLRDWSAGAGDWLRCFILDIVGLGLLVVTVRDQTIHP